jgi:hypothetical protein
MDNGPRRLHWTISSFECLLYKQQN